MTQEEKAKRYDESYKVAESIHRLSSDPAEIKRMEEIFPELKESDDEKIRKVLIEWFSQEHAYDDFGGIAWDRIVAWLEKQGEQRHVPDWMPKFLDELRSKKNYLDWEEHKDIEGGILAIIKWMNPNYFNGKDGEQKPTDKVEQKFKVGDVVRSSNDTMLKIVGITDYCYNCVTCATNDEYSFGFNIQDEFELVEQKPSWSEEDDYNIQCLIAKIVSDIQKGNVGRNQELIDWLKSLKDRIQPQPKQKWSQNDIEMIDWLIRCCEEEHKELCNDRYGHQEIVSDLKRDCRKKWDWLESLKNKVAPKSNWKPTEEQLKQLHKYTIDNRPLTELYEQLKKL